jgi:hypothetical protein
VAVAHNVNGAVGRLPVDKGCEQAMPLAVIWLQISVARSPKWSSVCAAMVDIGGLVVGKQGAG